MSVEAATKAVDEDRITLALLDHLIGGPREFTREEAAARTGVDVGTAEIIEHAAGLLTDAGYSETDIHQLALVGRLTRLLPTRWVLDTIRADGPLMRSLALRTVSTAQTLLFSSIEEEHEDPVDAGVALAEAAGPLLDLSTQLIGESYRRLVLNLITSDLVVEALRDPDETVTVAVGFVDVVGYTSLSARVDPRGLDEVLTRFESASQRIPEAHPGVTLVKFMGDAAMFVAKDPAVLVDALLELVAEPEESAPDIEPIPVSGGISYGPALLRGGDYFGTPVNEAARLTDLARNHSLLVSEEVSEALDGAFTLRRIGSVRLHGLGRRRPHAVRGRA